MAINNNFQLVLARQVSSDNEEDSSTEESEKDTSEDEAADHNSIRRFNHLIYSLHEVDHYFLDFWDIMSPCFRCIELSHVLTKVTRGSKMHVKITEEMLPEKIHNKGHLKYGSSFSALHAACVINNLELVKLLVENGVDVNAQTDNSYSPMHVLLKNNNADVSIVNYLASHGAVFLLKDCCGQTPLHVAAEKSHISCVETILRYQYSVNDIDSAKFTPLMKAASAGSFQIVDMLVAHGADPNIVTDNCLALHYGVGNVEVFKYLIQKTDLRHLDEPECFMKLLRIIIMIKNSIDCLEILVKSSINRKFHLGCEHNLQNFKYTEICWIGFLSLQQPYLSFKNWKRIVSVLLENGLSVNCDSTDCMPPLSVVTMMAFRYIYQRRYIAKLIRCGADINYPNAAAPQALIFCCMYRKSKTMLRLLQNSDFATPDSVLTANIKLKVCTIPEIAPKVIHLFLKLGMTPSTVKLLSIYPVERVPDYTTFAENVCSLQQLTRAAVRHMFFSKWSNLHIDNILKNLNLPHLICKYLKYFEKD